MFFLIWTLSPYFLKTFAKFKEYKNIPFVLRAAVKDNSMTKKKHPVSIQTESYYPG